MFGKFLIDIDNFLVDEVFQQFADWAAHRLRLELFSLIAAIYCIWFVCVIVGFVIPTLYHEPPNWKILIANSFAIIFTPEVLKSFKRSHKEGFAPPARHSLIIIAGRLGAIVALPVLFTVHVAKGDFSPASIPVLISIFCLWCCAYLLACSPTPPRNPEPKTNLAPVKG